MYIGMVNNLDEAEAAKVILLNGYLCTTRTVFEHFSEEDDISPKAIERLAGYLLNGSKVFNELIKDLDEKIAEFEKAEEE